MICINGHKNTCITLTRCLDAFMTIALSTMDPARIKLFENLTGRSGVDVMYVYRDKRRNSCVIVYSSTTTYPADPHYAGKTTCGGT